MSAGSTDWRHRRQRLSGKSVSTTPNDGQATRSGAGRGCTARRRSPAGRGRAAPLAGGGKPMRQRSRALRQGPGAAESKSCGPGQGRPEWRRSGLMVGGRAAGAELRSNSEAASQALIERESPVQPPARLQPAGKNGAWGGGGGLPSHARVATECRRAALAPRVTRTRRLRSTDGRSSGRGARAEGLGTAGTRPGPRW